MTQKQDTIASEMEHCTLNINGTLLAYERIEGLYSSGGDDENRTTKTQTMLAFSCNASFSVVYIDSKL